MNRRVPPRDIFEWLSYDGRTGAFTWKKAPKYKPSFEGKIAGCIDKSTGYIFLKFRGVIYLAHRVAWLFAKSEMPKEEIDHKNGVRHDNKINNLREATSTLNKQNQRRLRSNNTLGFTGLKRVPSGKFTALIRIGSEKLHLGTFGTPVEAGAAYLKAKRKLHEGCTI